MTLTSYMQETPLKTIYSEKLKRSLIVCVGCGKGITGTAYSSTKSGAGFKCEPCVDKEIARKA